MLTLLLVCVTVLLPLWFVAVAFANEAADFCARIENGDIDVEGAIRWRKAQPVIPQACPRVHELSSLNPCCVVPLTGAPVTLTRVLGRLAPAAGFAAGGCASGPPSLSDVFSETSAELSRPQAGLLLDTLARAGHVPFARLRVAALQLAAAALSAGRQRAAWAAGSVAVAILAKLGYSVTAVTGRPEEEAYLKSLGAKQILDRAELSEPEQKLAARLQEDLLSLRINGKETATAAAGPLMARIRRTASSPSMTGTCRSFTTAS